MAKQSKQSGSAGVVNRDVNIADCAAHEWNYQKHSDAQIVELRASLRAFSQVRSIVVQAHARDKRFTIVAGHGVWMAAKLEGFAKLRADVIPPNWSAARVLAYLAADNELGRYGVDPDQAQLAAILRDIAQAEGDALAQIAAGGAEQLDALMSLAEPKVETADVETLIDRAAVLQKKWQVKHGDLWQCGKHRLLIGDNTIKENLDRLMQGDIADLLLIDPPYGKLKIFSDGTVIGVENAAKRTQYNPEHYQGEGNFRIEPFLQAATGLYKNSVIWGGNYFVDVLPISTAWLVWDKRAGERAFFSDCELAWTDLPMGARVFQFAWQGMIRAGKKEERLHPTQKPIELMEWILVKLAPQASIVADFFVGSGTTCLAAERQNRIGRFCELSPEYGAVTLERWTNLTGQTPKRLE